MNTSFRERYRNTPYCVLVGRAPRASLSALTTVTGGEWNVDVMDADSLRANVRHIVDEQECYYKDVQAAVAETRETKRKIAQGKTVLPKFAVGDFVLYSRVRRQGLTPKLMSTWSDPWRVVGTDRAHVHSGQNIVSGKVSPTLVRMCQP